MSTAPLTTLKDDQGRDICGARTMVCGCGHQRRSHKAPSGRFERCTEEGCSCEQFLGIPCTRTVGLMANGRCRLHGGLSPSGLASPHYKTGEKSRFLPLPEQLAQTFEESFRDPELLSLRRQIALHEAREAELAEKLSDGAPTAAAIRASWNEMKAARRAQDPVAIAAAWKAHEDAIDGDASNGHIWSELRREATLIARLKDRENERLDRLHQRLSREQAIAFIRAMSTSVRDAAIEQIGETVIRTNLLRAVSARFALLTAGGGSADIDASRTIESGEVVDSTADD